MRFFLSLFFLSLFFIDSRSQSTDSLVKVLATKEGPARIEILHELVLNIWLNYPKKAMGYGEEALELSSQTKDSTNISKSLRLIAGVHYYQGDYDQSLSYNVKALDMALELEDSTLINNGYNNLGLIYFELGSYQTSFEYLLRSKSMKELRGEVYGMPTTLNNIGRVFDRVGNPEEARKYFLEAYDVAIQEDNQNEIYALNNIGITYLNEDLPKKAMIYFRRALERADELENVNWGSVALRGIAESFMMQNLYDSAEPYCLRSLYASVELDDKKGMAEGYYTLAKYACGIGENSIAHDYLTKSDEFAKKLKLRQQLLDNAKIHIKIHRELNELDSVIKHQDEFMYLQDSLFKDVASRNLTLIPIKLKEESDRSELAQKEDELQNKSFTNRLYATVLLVSIPLAMILIVLLRKNQRAHRELLMYNEDLQQTQKLLITSEKMASLGIMAAGIAHEINNPLNFIQNGVEALSTKISEDDQDKKKELEPIFHIVKEGVNRASKIVRSLSHFSRKGPEMNEECNIKEIIENCLLILHNKIKNKVRVLTDFSSTTQIVKGNEGRLHQAMMNIIANAEQAIENTGTIKITTIKRDNFLDVTIEDNGEGIPKENLSKISDPFFTTKAPGEGTGLGLFITFSIIEEHNGQIDVISSPGKGTIFTISLPTS